MPVRDQAERLRGASLRVTAQRTAVLHVLEQHPHSDAGFVARAVREVIGAASIQAVYNVLDVLIEAGLVRKFQPAGSPGLFELRADANHHHVVCRACGAVADVDCTVGRRPCLTPSATDGFIVDEAEVVFWGFCRSCTNSSEQRRDLNTTPITLQEIK
ncbi:Fur family transcriptional regulator [Streptomyces sp. GbtcB6]|uniref:Fur family transcriptional regulator n=1 Tax=Streptomyces sp. GbtcB6 TaxID=2824751 RepID=UPI001C301ED6|nr:Fur family transcriptional regulator [Streptomyces sp. GbtcB6]